MSIIEFDEAWSLHVAVTWMSQHNFLVYIGSLPIYLLPLTLVGLLWRNRGNGRRVAVKVFLGSVVAWQVISQAIGTWFYSAWSFRDRPFAGSDWYPSSQELFFERPEKAFPSDHASVLLFVCLAFLHYRYPKLGLLFGLALVLTIVGRVGAGFHYFGDMLGGLAIGGITYGLMYCLDRPLERLFDRFNLMKAVNEG